MDARLGTSFQNYSRDPRRNNTVPGQFSEWLHGETLVNQGMMLSPWFPPRYLWAAIEGAAAWTSRPAIRGSIRTWRRSGNGWACRTFPYQGLSLTWLAVRAPDLRKSTLTTTSRSPRPHAAYEDDISAHVHAIGSTSVVAGVAPGRQHAPLRGNTDRTALTTALRGGRRSRAGLQTAGLRQSAGPLG